MFISNNGSIVVADILVRIEEQDISNFFEKLNPAKDNEIVIDTINCTNVKKICALMYEIQKNCLKLMNSCQPGQIEENLIKINQEYKIYQIIEAMFRMTMQKVAKYQTFAIREGWTVVVTQEPPLSDKIDLSGLPTGRFK